MKKIIFILILLFITGFSHTFSINVGDKVPKFANPDLSGKYILSNEIIGKGWVILDFFATDCEPCKKELPELEEILFKFEDNGLKIIVFATDAEGRYVVEPYFKENPTNVTVVIDRYKVAVEKFGVEGIPTLFLVDPRGEIVIKGTGYNEEVLIEITKTLQDAFLEN